MRHSVTVARAYLHATIFYLDAAEEGLRTATPQNISAPREAGHQSAFEERQHAQAEDIEMKIARGPDGRVTSPVFLKSGSDNYLMDFTRGRDGLIAGSVLIRKAVA
jgi:hypothetical protein